MFNHHAQLLNNKMKTRNNTLKGLSETTWAKYKTTTVRAYNAIGRSLVNYAAPI